MDDAIPSLADRAWLADWRRRIAELYAEVRATAASDPAAAWERWRIEREALFRGHPESPVPASERDAFRARHWPYDEALRFGPVVEPATTTPGGPGAQAGIGEPLRSEAPGDQAAAAVMPQPPLGIGITLPNSGSDVLAFDRVGTVSLPLGDGEATLDLFWMRGYAGGVFLPFLDGTNGIETYGAGRYVLDTAKGADLGGDVDAGTIVVDLNFAFHPSCAFDPRWACPLAPPSNRIQARVEAGERLR
jgi:hypothetical protein